MKKYILLSALLMVSFSIAAQQISKKDYERAAAFHMRTLGKKIFNLNVLPVWFSDSSGFFYVTQNKKEKLYNKFEFATMKASLFFDHDRLAKVLSDTLKKTVNSKDLPIINIRYINKTQLSFNAGDKNYTLDLNNYTLTANENGPFNPMEKKSPDGNWIAYSDKFNLFVKSTKTGEVKQLSTAGKKNYEYASYYGWGEIMEGENGERPAHFSVQWSPDSKWIQTYICDLTKAEKMYLLDWSIDSLYKPKLLSYYRGSPGDTNMVYMTPVIFNVQTGEETRKDVFRNVNAASLEWSKEPGILYIEDHVRGYQQIDLYSYNAVTKTQILLYGEKSKTNIDNYNSWTIDDWGKMIITSERDGWKQIYTLDTKDKTLKPVTNGAYYVNDISFVNEKAKNIIYTASGKEQGRNPYYQFVYSIGLDGKEPILLTPEIANHEIYVSPDGKYFVDNISAPDQPTKTVLRETSTGKILQEISKAIIDDLLAMNYKFPMTFTAIGRDDTTAIYGAIWKPTNFDPSKKYPVIDQTYTGPHTNMFPRSFALSLGRSNQALAELGFIVITIDGMGTAGRSKYFHNFSYKNMGKNLTDHVLAIRELGKRYTWIDTTKVGIFGHSAGGYDAGHAVLEFPNFYKVAVASSADHDFRMEKDWWPEMYMGWPVDSTYNEVSNITMAKNLKGKLLIVHGGIDENVNPSATFKLAEALVKADKEFDMLIFPSQHHGYTGKFNEYFNKKLWNYFVENLMKAKPIWDFQLVQ